MDGNDSQWLLSQLRGHVAQLREAFELSRQPLNDSAPGISEFWKLLERALRHSSRFFAALPNGNSEDAECDYWRVFEQIEALERQATAVSKLTANRTACGKGRAFLRMLLNDQCMSAAFKAAVSDASVMKRYYHTGALLRSERAWKELVSVLSALTETPFELSLNLSFDKSWPVFSAKQFADTTSVSSRNARNTSAESIFSVTSGAKANMVSYPNASPSNSETASLESQHVPPNTGAPSTWQFEALKDEKSRLEKEVSKLSAALGESRKAQKAADAYVTSLKEKIAQLRQKQSSSADDVHMPSRRGTEVHLSPDPELVAQLRHDLEAEVSDSMRARVDDLQSRVDDLQAQLDHAHVAAQDTQEDHARAVRRLETEVERQKTIARDLELQLSSAKQDLHVLKTASEAEAEALRVQLAAKEQIITQSMDSLKEVESERATACEKLAAVRSEITEVQSRLLVRDEQLRAVYEGKVAANQRSTDLLSFIDRTTSTWQSDSEATACPNCTKLFSVILRRHHCRMCGQIFCHDCCSQYRLIAHGKRPVRVCELCISALERLESIRHSMKDDVSHASRDADVSRHLSISTLTSELKNGFAFSSAPNSPSIMQRRSVTPVPGSEMPSPPGSSSSLAGVAFSFDRDPAKQGSS